MALQSASTKASFNKNNLFDNYWVLDMFEDRGNRGNRGHYKGKHNHNQNCI